MYDISELAKLGEIDTESGVKNFNGVQEYFDKLTEFTHKSPGYLVGYNPTMVVYSDEIKADFLKKVTEVRSILTSLGMAERASEMTYLENAVHKNDSAILADEMSVFAARMERISNQIISVRKPEKKIILAVDDKPELLKTITGILENKYNVIGVTTGKEALKVIENQNPSLFILDIEMPQMNGYELVGEIRKNKKFHSSPILFLTGKSSRADVMSAKEHGVKDYILKPVDKDLLMRKIRKYLG